MKQKIKVASPSLRDLGYLNEDEAAAALRVCNGTLRNWRSKGQGPAYTTIGDRPAYSLEGLKHYLSSRTVTPGRAPTLVDGKPRRRTIRQNASV